MNAGGNRARGQLIVRRLGPDFRQNFYWDKEAMTMIVETRPRGAESMHAVNLSFNLRNYVLTNDSRGTPRTTYFNFSHLFLPFLDIWKNELV